MPTVEMAEQTTRAIPRARLKVFEHSRHFPFLEEPDKFLRVVREFLEEG
jgi:proline iminopeptidase